MVTGKWPVIGISQNIAFTAETSDGTVGLNSARYAATFGKLASRYGLPNARNATGVELSVSRCTNAGKSPASIGLVVKDANTLAEHWAASPTIASSAAPGRALSTSISRACGARLRI